MNLQCPECKQIAEWDGYPSDPQLSTVICLKCHYASMGCCFKRVKSKK